MMKARKAERRLCVFELSLSAIEVKFQIFGMLPLISIRRLTDLIRPIRFLESTLPIEITFDV